MKNLAKPFIILLLLILNTLHTNGQCSVQTAQDSNNSDIYANKYEQIQAISGLHNNGDKSQGIKNTYLRILKVVNPNSTEYLLHISRLGLDAYRDLVLPRKLTLNLTNGERISISSYSYEELGTANTLEFHFSLSLENIGALKNYGVTSILLNDYKRNRTETAYLNYKYFLKDQINCLEKYGETVSYPDQNNSISSSNQDYYIGYNTEYFLDDYVYFSKSIRLLMSEMQPGEHMKINSNEPLFISKNYLNENLDGGGILLLGEEKTNLLMVKIGHSNNATILAETSDGNIVVRNVLGRSVIIIALKDNIKLTYLGVLHEDTQKKWKSEFNCYSGKRPK